ncbi:uridine kinase family protein [Indiicoccus explosivorum]|uniref:uridine kinase family protein n=1 Tax=Indiicoccus explosivorum TaxID=1917864 RepID=UPI000B43E23A|nr:phosphoribulokinase [Indiicoccus explosivorum]
MDRLAQEIADWITAMDRRLVIGVSGHGAAGKTTFTNAVVDRLGRQEVNYLNTDPYIVSSDVRKYTRISYTYQNEEHRGKMTACHPAAHHVAALERDIRMLRAGVDVFTIDTPYKRSGILAADRNVTIVEGMTVAFSDPELFDLSLYFYTNGDTEFHRRSSRDIKERGMELAYLKQSHAERRIQYDVFMHPYSARFDFIVKNSDDALWVEKNAGIPEIRMDSPS